MTIAKITVPARWTDPSGGTRWTPAVFKLGKGPCGLTVIELRAKIGSSCLQIVQRHEDGPPKTFVYPLDQLTGRVEIEQLP